VPLPTPAELAERVTKALDADCGRLHVVHEAGADTALIAALEDLEKDRPPGDCRSTPCSPLATPRWSMRGEHVVQGTRPADGDSRVKAFYDGAMGSRGAFFLAPYSGQARPHRRRRRSLRLRRRQACRAMKSGFQVSIHAIGDRANREALDFFETIMRESPSREGDTSANRACAESSRPPTSAGFGTIGVIASMQPSHAVEDMAWAEERIGRQRAAGAYAWRALRVTGARMTLNSDSAGDRLQHLLWSALGGDADGSSGQTRRRLAQRPGISRSKRRSAGGRTGRRIRNSVSRSSD
jgi:hypothetical protein